MLRHQLAGLLYRRVRDRRPEAVEPVRLSSPAASAEVDWIQRLLAHAGAEGATLGEALAALKDRLIGEPTVTGPEESKLLETLVGSPLDTPIAEAPDAEAALRRACGVFLATPEFQLIGSSGPDLTDAYSGLIVPGTSFQTLCNELGALLFDPGQLQCGEHALQILASQ